MVVLGIVLIAVAVLLGLGVSVSSADSATLEVFGVEFGVVVPTVFFLGAAAGAALMFGLWLVKKGLGRGYRRHKEVKELRHQVEHSPTATSTAPPSPGTPDDRGATAERGPGHSAARTDHNVDHSVDHSRGPVADPTSAESKNRADRLATEPYNVVDDPERSPSAPHRPPSA